VSTFCVVASLAELVLGDFFVRWLTGKGIFLLAIAIAIDLAEWGAATSKELMLVCLK
jgi:hypothetical protein